MSSAKMDEEFSSDDDDVLIRRPRHFKPRISYNHINETYEFNERFRLNYDKFTFLRERLHEQLEYHSRRNHALTPAQQLQIALHWFGTGAQFHSVGDMHGVSKATVCRVVHKVVDAIEATLIEELVRWPDNVGAVINEFSELAGMPLVCGAVDGTLIKMDAPTNFEPTFVDRHGNHSINVMVVCIANMQFSYVYADWPGSASDARVLRNSGLFREMERGFRPFPGSVLLGDSIYPLKPWLIPPIVQNPNSPEQQRFARAHKKTRRVIECALGILKEKFPCLNYLEPRFVCKVIKCCVALCNLSRMENEVIEIGDVDNILEENNNEVGRGAPNDVHIDEIDVLGEEKLNFFYRHYAN